MVRVSCDILDLTFILVRGSLSQTKVCTLQKWKQMNWLRFYRILIGPDISAETALYLLLRILMGACILSIYKCWVCYILIYMNNETERERQAWSLACLVFGGIFWEKDTEKKEWRHSRRKPLLTLGWPSHPEDVVAFLRLAHSIHHTITMKLSFALATLAVGGASAFSVNQNGLRTSTQLNAVRQPIMAGNWKVNTHKIQ